MKLKQIKYMNFSEQIKTEILESDNKAFATNGKHGLNVVPVSTIRIVNDEILLMNYFLNKTLENILENPKIALTCWKGLKGYQIKGSIVYVSEGEIFLEAKEWVRKNVPNRVLKGLIILNPEEIYDISPTV